MSLSKLKSYLAIQMHNFASEKEEFLTKLEQNPMHAMEWGDSFLRGVARFELAKLYLDDIEYAEGQPESERSQTDDELYENIMTDVERHVINGMANPPRSTSRMSNYMREEQMVVRAQLLSKMKRSF